MIRLLAVRRALRTSVGGSTFLPIVDSWRVRPRDKQHHQHVHHHANVCRLELLSQQKLRELGCPPMRSHHKLDFFLQTPVKVNTTSAADKTADEPQSGAQQSKQR